MIFWFTPAATVCSLLSLLPQLRANSMPVTAKDSPLGRVKMYWEIKNTEVAV